MGHAVSREDAFLQERDHLNGGTRCYGGDPVDQARWYYGSRKRSGRSGWEGSTA